MPAVDYERTIRDYFDACTAGDARAIASFFAPDAVHYFPDGDTYPDGSPQRAFRGADAIGHGFGDRFGGEFRTRWTVDHVIVDAERREAVIEWSNFKPSVSPDARLRGAEFYRFDVGRQDRRDPRVLRVSARWPGPSVRARRVRLRGARVPGGRSLDAVRRAVPAFCERRQRREPRRANPPLRGGRLRPRVLRLGRGRRLEEVVHVGGELAVVLEEEAVGRVGVDLDARVWEQARQQVRVAQGDGDAAAWTTLAASWITEQRELGRLLP